MLTEDRHGAWHAEGKLPDQAVKTFWLVKRPRGNTAADRQVLRNEAAFMRVAKNLGLRVHADIVWEQNNLFVPRFDRAVSDHQVMRYGMESLCSLAGIADFEQAGNPDWKAVVERFGNHRDHLKTELRRFAQLVERLPDIMHECDVDGDVIEHRLRAIDDHTRRLLNL